jgi:hypothetical protein
MQPPDVRDTDQEVMWDNDLQERLNALDREGAGSRPWREVLDEMRRKLADQNTGGTSDVR